MADEITINSGMSLIKSNLKSALVRNDYTADQTTGRCYEDVQNIATTAGGEVLAVGSISTVGWAYFKNLNATNFCKVGPEAAGAIVDTIKILPGETAGPMKMATNTIRAIADTGAIDLWYRLYEA